MGRPSVGKITAMTVKERLQQVVSEMTEDEAADALALVAGARAGATPTDIYGTAWGKVLADVDPEALVVRGDPTIAIPDGIPDIS
jgi:flagellar motility protein MotE (MotC chaperone)